MIPKVTQINTDDLPGGLNLVAVEEPPAPPPAPAEPAFARVRPELREAALASWRRNEEAYRYLGR